MTNIGIGIRATASWLPSQTLAVGDIFAAEGHRLEAATRDRLGVEQVHHFTGESPTEMAVAVSRQVLEDARLGPFDLHAIIDFSSLPQRYVEPAWSMSNELQAELGAKAAFTLGYSGGGASNLHVALKFAVALIADNAEISNVLLVAAERAIPGNRVILAPDPVSVIGDGAAALIVSREAPKDRILGTHVTSDGANHDVFFIPGGGITHPTRLDLYRLTLDTEKFARIDRPAIHRRASDGLMRRLNGTGGPVDHQIGANFCREDVVTTSPEGANSTAIALDTLARHGHVPACDLVFNYLALKAAGLPAGSRVLLATHGLGFTAGATLLSA